MSNFSFGQAPAANTATSFGFGSGTSFGSPATSSTLSSSTGLPTFGAPATNTNVSFGGLGATTAPTFGANAAVPAFGATTATPAFGQTAAPTFGQTATSSFGANTGAPTFGSTAAPTFGSNTAPTFGSSTTAPAFGQTAPPAFGSNTFGAATPFGAGTTAPNFSTSTSTTLNFNPPATSSSFGSSTAPTLNLSFGGGATTSTASGFNFATPASSAAPSFGLGGGFNTAPQTSLATGFGTSTLGGTSSGLGFGLGGSLPTTSVAGFGSQLGTSKPTLSLGTATTTTSTPFVGLGGVDTTIPSISGQTGSQTGSHVEQKIEKAAKDNIVPPEILQQVEEFKEFVKLQKNMSSEFSRTSTKPFHKIQADIKSMSHQLDCIQNQLHVHTGLVKKLRSDAGKSLQHAEMAQQTYDMPSGFQLEYFAPDEYFAELATNLEQQLNIFRNEIGNMKKLLDQSTDSSTLNKEVVAMGLKHIHSVFLALASRMQTLHTGVEKLKESCLNLRRHLLHDNTDIFENLNTNYQTVTKEKFTPRTKNISGPPLFSSSTVPPAPHGIAGSHQVAANIRPTFSTTLNFGLGQNTSMIGGGSAPSSFSGNSDANESRPFQLQQPPVGNKRGKR